MQTLAHDPFSANPQLQEAVKQAARLLWAALPEGSFAEREQTALAAGNEVVRQMLGNDLEEIAAEFDGETVESNGRRYVKHAPGTVVYHSLCGPIPVFRYTYRDAQIRNGPTIVPLELAAGLVERATPALGYALLRSYAVHDSRETETQLKAAARVPPSRATIERIDRAVGEELVTHSLPIERALRRSEKLPEGTSGITIGLDRTSVPMVERPEGEPKPSPHRKKPLLRRSSGSYEVVFRMAYVGTVSFVNEHGEALEIRRYATPACDDPRELIPRMMSDVRASLEREAGLAVGVVQDGAHEMWNRTQEGLQLLQTQGVLEVWHEGIDRYHLMERLGNALKLVDDDAKSRVSRLKTWSEQLDQTDSAIDRIEAYFKRKYAEASPPIAEELWEHLVYFRNHKHRMRYVTLQAVGLPCGSGVTESAAKTVIGHRAKRSGQRWCEQGLRAVLTARAALLSNRFSKLWQHLARRYTATVTLAA